MIPVAEAQARILAGLPSMAAEQVGLSDALGRVLATDVAARLTQPPVAMSAMDGYAVRAADVAAAPARLKVVGHVPAGQSFAGTVGPGEAVRIFTGAPVPAGADTIVIQEDTVADATGGTVEVRTGAAAGTYVRPAGLDFHAGATLLTAGRVLSARDVGLAAAMNVPWLMVRQRPRVAILATGDELALPGDSLAPTQIIGSSSFALAALATAAGATPMILGIARDDAQSLRSLAAGAQGADFLVTTGGASVGDHDLVQQVLGEVGLAVDFWRIAMRPGKPLMFGRLGAVPMLGLPGNPVSSLVCAVLFLRPALARMLNATGPTVPLQTARLGRDLGANDRRQDYLRAALSTGDDNALVATPFAIQDSSVFSGMAHADCLVVRPPNAPAAAAGSRVDTIPLAGSLVSI